MHPSKSAETWRLLPTHRHRSPGRLMCAPRGMGWRFPTHLSPLRSADPRSAVGGVVFAFYVAWVAGIAAYAGAQSPGLPSWPTDAQGRAGDGIQISVPSQPCTRLVVLPDRTSGNDAGLAYLDLAVEDITRLRPDAVLAVGDLVQGYTRDPAEWDRQAQAYLDRVRRMGVPFLPTVGNHDVMSGTRVAGDRTFEDRYRATFGPRWYRADFAHLVALVLDSDQPVDGRNPGLGADQLEWLNGQLAALGTDPRAIVVCIHRPLWRTGSARRSWDEQVHPALRKAGVDAVIAGHLHALQLEETRDGIPYLIVGTCGGAVDQLPLAGQVHHLTLINACDGRIEMSHLPVGSSMDAGFIRAADQELAHQLKRDAANFAFEGTLPEAAPPATARTLTCRIRNPLPVPITVEIAAEPEDPEGELAGGGERFLSMARRDMVNRSTWHASSPWVLRPPASVTVAPRSDAAVPCEFTAPAGAHRAVAPLIGARASFVDSQSRTVPVLLRARPAIARSLSAEGSDGPGWPISAWPWSPYDTPEADARLRVLAMSERGLEIELDVPDGMPVGDARSRPDGDCDSGRDSNPMNDAIRLEVISPSGMRTWLVEPHARHACGDDVVSAWSVEELVTHAGPGWRLRVAIRPECASQMRGINVFVADNDRTYHTQWRSLCPPGTHAPLDAAQPSALNAASEGPAASPSTTSPAGLPDRRSPRTTP